MKRRTINSIVKLSLIMTVLSLAFIGTRPVLANAKNTGGVFYFTTTTNSYLAYINNLNTNNQPNWILLATQVWQQSGSNNYDPHPIGVWYNPRNGEWSVFNEDRQPIPIGTTFRIHYLNPLNDTYSAILQLTTTTSNSTGQYTIIDNPLINNDPHASITMTQDYTGAYNPHEISIWYNASNGRWEIFNEDLSAIPLGTSFNLYLEWQYDYLQTTTTANNSGYITYIDNPVLNGDPSHFVLVTPVYDSGGSCGCILNNHTIGVWYDPIAARWAIYNVDLAPMPVGTQFFYTV